MNRAAWRWVIAMGACAALFGVDHLLARVAVATNAAGALLSPGGASLEAFAVAASFLAVRLTLCALLCGMPALCVWALLRRRAWPFGTPPIARGQAEGPHTRPSSLP